MGVYENDIDRAIAGRRNLGVLIFRAPAKLAYCSDIAKAQLAEVDIFIEAGVSDDVIHNPHCKRLYSAVELCFEQRNSEESWVVLGDAATSAAIVTVHFCEHKEEKRGIVVGTIRSYGTSDWDSDGHRVMTAFGLTKREAQLSLHISHGKDLATFASSFFLSMNTVKTHRRQLFRKMGVNRQVLVAIAVWAALR